MLVPYINPPSGWAFCLGQELKIADNPVLFKLLGTTFGGNGGTTFFLPDLRGRVPLGVGLRPGLENYSLGQQGGSEKVALSTDQMPKHTHDIQAVDDEANSGTPSNAFPADTSPASYFSGDPSNASTTMAAQMVSTAGGGVAHENRPPYLALNYIIALKGYYPPFD